MTPRLWRWSPVLVAVLALALAGWAAGGGTGLATGESPLTGREPLPSGPPASPGGLPSTGPTAAAERSEQAFLPAWVDWLMGAVVLGLAGTLLALLVAYLLTQRVLRREIVDQPASQPPGAGTQLEQVREAVRAGLADLDGGADARRAVIACWLRLERVAAAAGTARLAADTPADLVARLLARHRVDDPTLARLAGAYRMARYAPAEVTEELLATARRALSEVADQLGARVPEPRP